MTATSHDAEPHEWLSAHLFFEGQLYGREADRVALDLIAPLLASLQERGSIRRHFFIRYSEDGNHLRLRLLPAPGADRREIRLLVDARARSFAGLAESPSPIALEGLRYLPYEPEVERYGGPEAIEVAERFFHVSSDVALDLLRKIPSRDRGARLGKSLLSSLVLLHTLFPDRATVADLGARYGDGSLRFLARNQGQHDAWAEAFADGYQEQSKVLAHYLEAAWEALEASASLTPELDDYRERLQPIAESLRDLFRARKLVVYGETVGGWPSGVGAIALSYVHMMNNRLGVDQREEAYLALLTQRTLGTPAARAAV